MSISPTLVLYVDSHLQENTGHYSTYCEAFVQSMRSFGMATEIVGPVRAGASLESIAPVHRVLHEPQFKAPKNNIGKIIKLIIWRALRLLAAPLNIIRLGFVMRSRNACPVFVPNAEFVELLTISALSLFPRIIGGRPHIVAFLRYEPRLGYFGYRLLFLMQRMIGMSSIRYASDSESLAAIYQRLGSPTVAVVPIPHVTPSAAIGPERSTSDALIVGSLGDIRDDKGAHLFPLLIRWIEDRGLSSKFIFKFQWVKNAFFSGTYEAIGAMGRRSVNVELTSGFLKREEYLAHLDSLDVVLLMYDPKTYAHRTSGALLETISRGKIPVVSKNTWLEQVSLTFQVGKAAPAHDVAAVGACLLEIASNRATYMAEARRASARLCDVHSQHHFSEKIASLLEIA